MVQLLIFKIQFFCFCDSDFTSKCLNIIDFKLFCCEILMSLLIKQYVNIPFSYIVIL